MPLVTLSIPNEKLSLFADLLNSLGIIQSANIDNSKSEMAKGSNLFDYSNASFKKYFDWEHYQNELEFE